MLSKEVRNVLVGIIGVVGALVLFSSISIVGTGKTGVITRFGAVQERTLDSGIHLKVPFVERVHKIENQTQIMEDKSNGMSKDKQSVDYEVSVNYKLIDASYIYKNIGKEYEQKVITKNVSDAVKNILSTYDCESLTDERSSLSDLAKEELQRKVNNTLGGNENIIRIESVQINNFGFSDEFTKAKEEKAVAQQKLLAEQQNTQIKQEQANQKKVEAQGEANALIIKANGESESNRIINESLTDNVLKNKFIDGWDKKLPVVMGNGENILNIDSLLK